MKNEKLNEKAPIYLLNSDKYDGIINYPVIKINFLSPSFSFENVDYILFTSKNGVRAIDNLTNEWKKYPSFAIGKATSKEIEKLGGTVFYVAKSSYGDEFAKEINENFNNKTFLFFRAKKLVSNIKEYFKNNLLQEVIIYETTCNIPDIKIKKSSIVIFTSPSTVKCFSKLENFDNIKAIAIGKKTKKELLKYTNEIYMPKIPLIDECIKLAKSL